MAVAMRITAPAAQEDAPSQLFKDYLAARAEYLAIFSPAVPGYADESQEWRALEARASAAFKEAFEAIRNRVPTCFCDLVELAEVALLENDELWDQANLFVMEPALVRGVLALAGRVA